MKVRRFKAFSGLSLVEVTVTMVILIVLAMGAMGYRYHAARHARIANAQITATRIAQLLLEDWKSTGGSTDYDPTDLSLGFTSAEDSEALEKVTVEGTVLKNNVFYIAVDSISMEIVLKWADVEVDTDTGVILRRLNVIVQYQLSPSPLIMTTYARIDGST